MDDVLTMEDIEARFDEESVLLKDPKLTELDEVKGGKLLWHSKDAEEVWQKAIELRPAYLTLFRVGEIPKDIAFWLSPLEVTRQ